MMRIMRSSRPYSFPTIMEYADTRSLWPRV